LGEAASSLELKLAAAPPQLPLSLYLIDNIRNALARPHSFIYWVDIQLVWHIGKAQPAEMLHDLNIIIFNTWNI